MTTPRNAATPAGGDIFDELAAVDDETTRRLHGRLVAVAERDGLLDVAYRVLDSPVGPLLVAGTAAGLVRVAYARHGHDDVLASLAGMVSPRLLEAPARLDPVARQLEEYFAGRRRGFDVPLDLRLARGFRREVLTQLREIAYGRTASYASVASAAGHPGAARAVGSACRTNPLPVVVPCHRVVRADGVLGEYVGGAAAKAALLDLEERSSGR
ncbi:MAG: methylated-DNA--[protein]-cysteine S-methyltransferase [Nocardioidaceae bacterium]